MATNNTTLSLNIKACLRSSKQPKKSTRNKLHIQRAIRCVNLWQKPPPQNKKRKENYLLLPTTRGIKKRWMGKTICYFPLSHCVHHLYSIALYFSVIKEEWIERNIEAKVHIREDKECFWEVKKLKRTVCLGGPNKQGCPLSVIEIFFPLEFLVKI